MKIPESEFKELPPSVKHDQILDRLFMLLVKGNIISLILGGAMGALITYLILHR